MENLIISSKFDNVFEFNITAQGLDVKTGRVFIDIKISDNLHYTIPCSHKTGQLWSISIPKDILDNGSYSYNMCVIVDDFYFEPVSGMLSVVSKEVIKVEHKTSDKPEAKKVTTKKVDTKKVDTKKTDTKKTDTKKTDTKKKVDTEKATESMDTLPQFQFFKTNHPYEQLQDHGEADKKVRQIIKELNEADTINVTIPKIKRTTKKERLIK